LAGAVRSRPREGLFDWPLDDLLTFRFSINSLTHPVVFGSLILPFHDGKRDRGSIFAKLARVGV
jgi:hypothetical protein